MQKLYILIPLDFQGKSGIHGPLRTYPELFALMGGRVPDLRGLFLRGYGSQNHAQNNGSTVGVTSTTHSSGELGQVQGDALRKINGFVSGQNAGFIDNFGGVFSIGELTQGYEGSTIRPNYKSDDFFLDTSRVVPTAQEVRPANTAVRYLVRSRP